MVVQSYLFFNGNCEEAVNFYKKALGARVDFTMRYKEAPEPPPPGKVPANWGDKIMHTSFWIGESMVMASDGCDTGPGFAGFSLSLTTKDEAEAKKAFNALSDDGKIFMPLDKTFWSPCFGLLTDKFGVQWMVSVPSPQQPE
jgi:PhnB protein